MRTTAGRSADAYFRLARDEWRRRVVRGVSTFLLVPAAVLSSFKSAGASTR
jgi:hypothetical protein